MAVYTASVRTGAGSTTLPIISLYAAAAAGGRIREIGCFNTTTTAFAIKLARLTTAGTQGAGLTESKHNSATDTVASCTAFTTHTGGPTITDAFNIAPIGAAIGAGVIWTFYEEAGLTIPVGTGNGIGIVVSTGTGQVADAYIRWEE